MTTMRTTDLKTLDSATKYPSIPTFHELDPKNGTLLEEPTRFTGTVLLTEKVDGANARIVTFPNGDYVIGAREELLYGRGDLIPNPKMGLVEALRSLAERLTTPVSGVRVLYLEVYGGKIGRAAGQYTGSGRVSYRLFDAAEVPAEVLQRTPAEVSTWRQNGGQSFLPEAQLLRLAAWEGLDLTPRLGSIDAKDLPASIADMHDFLSVMLPFTQVALDAEAGCQSEGIVLRTEDRSAIAKARFQNYERTRERSRR